MSHDQDKWTWSARLIGGTVVNEHRMKSIHALEASLIQSLSLSHESGKSQVIIDMPSGNALINNQLVRPLNPEYGAMDRVPVFFRRKKQLAGETTVDFRAVGYAVYHKGTLMAVPVIRVFEAAIDRRFFANWPDPGGIAVHCAKDTLLVQP